MKLLPIIAILVLALVAGAASAADWQGKESTKNGVLQVMNPSQLAEKPVSVSLSERWRLGGDSEDEDEFFGVISEIATDADGNVYLLDGQLHQVMIYSSDGEFIRAIGREGEGPGEFRRPSGMVVLPDGNIGVMQSMPGKIVMLTPQGDPADNFPFPGSDAGSEEGGTQMFFSCAATADQVIVGVNEFARDDSGFRIIFELVGANAQGDKVATYFQSEREQNMAKFEFDEKEIGGPAMQWDVGVDGRVYANTVFDGYRVDVWLPDGKPDRVILRDYEPRVRTKEEMEDADKRFRIVINGREADKIISKTDRDVQRLFPRRDGTLWVLSSRGVFEAPDGTMGVFDVFDGNGRLVRQVVLDGDWSIERDGYFFVKDRLYVVSSLVSARRAMYGGGDEEEGEEEAEPMAVICYDLGPDLHGAR
jgi:hypothetical protein